LALWPEVPLYALYVSLGATLTLSVMLAFVKERRGLGRWGAWSLSGLTLTALYMVLFGMANIVGSGQKFTARGAVSNLRKLLWAEMQCAPLVKRPCALSEMNGERPPEGLHTALLPADLQRLARMSEGEASLNEVGRIGPYYYRLSPMPQWGAEGWLAYAWPATDAVLQTFCVSSYEEVLELQERGAYVGFEKEPPPNACLGSLHIDPNPPLTPEMKAALERGDKPPPHVHTGEDGGVWSRWRGKRTRISRKLRP
jgi:hypothetical protein